MSIDWNLLAERIRSHQTFVLCSHVRPDCDALGSEIGLAGILKALGKRVRIINGHPTPSSLAFIDPDRLIEVVGTDVQSADISADCFIVLDTSAWAQLGTMADVLRSFSGAKLCIDHHVGEDDLGTEFFKDTKAEATGHLVAKLAKHLQTALDKPMATALFAAIATDTGWFRFGSTTAATYRIIADLLDAGAVPAEVYGELYEKDTLARVRLRGRIMSRTESEMDGRLVYTHCSREDFVETGALPNDTEDAINLTLAIAGTLVAVIFVEQPDGGYKLSFRSRCDVDCSQIAQMFGGGGHRAAAGATLAGDLESIQAQVLPHLRAALASC